MHPGWWAVALPLGIVLIGTLWLRRPAWQVALVAMAVTAAAVLLADGALVRSLPAAAGGALLLSADAGLVIIPGLLLNDLLRHSGAYDRILEWVAGWPVKPAVAAVILTAGFGPALESITGFGVSLLVTVPVLLRLLPRRRALLASMLSLTIMPWGTAGLATRVAAELAGLDQTSVGLASSLCSFAVFPCFAAAVALVVAERPDRYRVLTVAVGLGLVFSAVLVGVNAAGLVPLAGVAAGAVTGITGYLVLVRRGVVRRGLVPREGQGARPPWGALAPYAITIAVILAVRLIDYATSWGQDVSVRSGQVVFQPLLSPGIALLVAALALRGAASGRATLAAVAAGAWKPVTALFGFAATAQLMDVSGAVASIADLITRAGRAGFVVFAPLLAVGSGYLVGSNTGANALMVTAQAGIGRAYGEVAAVALQNSGAGHAVFASVPEVLLVLAVAGHGTRDEESMLLRFGFGMLAVVLAIMVAAALIIS
jgi:lactate permease